MAFEDAILEVADKIVLGAVVIGFGLGVLDMVKDWILQRHTRKE